MKKAKSESSTEMRREYKRSDFGAMERGKYAGRIKLPSTVVVLNPEVAKVFRSSEAVNDALMTLVNVAKAAVRRPRKRVTR